MQRDKRGDDQKKFSNYVIARDGGDQEWQTMHQPHLPGIVSKLDYSLAVILLLGNKRAMP